MKVIRNYGELMEVINENPKQLIVWQPSEDEVPETKTEGVPELQENLPA